MPGSFDWTPYLPTMYARLMKNLELPVHFKGGKNAPRESGLKTYEYGSAARWIVSTLVSTAYRVATHVTCSICHHSILIHACFFAGKQS
jgi:hypothetical protein